MTEFDLKNRELIKSCKPILKKMFKEHKKTYIDLFFHENGVYFDKFDLYALVKTGILTQIKSKVYRANVHVWPMNEKLVVTDFVISKHKKKGKIHTRKMNDVWHIIPEESAFIAKTACVKRGDIVLDLATGSGIIALFSAGKAKKVYATDINPKAVNYAKFNAILNDLEDRIEVRCGDLFEPVKRMKFDFIIWNGPTVAAPSSSNSFPLYVYGGMDGTNFTRRFIDQVWRHMKPTSRLQFYECSLGNKDESNGIKYLLKKIRGKKVKINIFRLTKKPQNFWKIDEIYTKYFIPNAPLNIRKLPLKVIKKWYSFIRRNNLSYSWLNMILVTASKKFEVKKILPKKNIRNYTYYSRRPYQGLSYKTIINFIEKSEKYKLKNFYR